MSPPFPPALREVEEKDVSRDHGKAETDDADDQHFVDQDEFGPTPAGAGRKYRPPRRARFRGPFASVAIAAIVASEHLLERKPTAFFLAAAFEVLEAVDLELEIAATTAAVAIRRASAPAAANATRFGLAVVDGRFFDQVVIVVIGLANDLDRLDAGLLGELLTFVDGSFALVLVEPRVENLAPIRQRIDFVCNFVRH